MCGRCTQRFSWREVHSFLRLGTPGPALNLRPRYNLAPSQNAAVVVVREEDGEPQLSMLRWGLIPEWAKDPNIGHKLINARAETAAVKPSYRAAYSRRRCLVPADGFYEWRREGELRQPWLIAPRDGGIVAFAGLWERWRVPEGAVLRGSLSERRAGEIVETLTILTTEANTTMQALHHRMPVRHPSAPFVPGRHESERHTRKWPGACGSRLTRDVGQGRGRQLYNDSGCSCRRSGKHIREEKRRRRRAHARRSTERRGTAATVDHEDDGNGRRNGRDRDLPGAAHRREHRVRGTRIGLPHRVHDDADRRTRRVGGELGAQSAGGPSALGGGTCSREGAMHRGRNATPNAGGSSWECTP